jgi:hypothetical protein
MPVTSQTIDKADFKSKLLAHFDTFQRGAAQDNSPRALSALQQEAFKQFESLDLPTTKHEEWKYTNLRNLLQNDFRFPTESQSFVPNAADVAPHLMDHGDANVLVFVNGFYRRDLSALSSPVEELHVENLGQAHAKYTEVIDKYFRPDRHLPERRVHGPQHGRFRERGLHLRAQQQGDPEAGVPVLHHRRHRGQRGIAAPQPVRGGPQQPGYLRGVVPHHWEQHWLYQRGYRSSGAGERRGRVLQNSERNEPGLSHRYHPGVAGPRQ